MYFVNRSKIEKTLEYFDDIIKVLDQESSFTNSVMNKLALERIIHVLVESMLDTGNMMIDGFIMRDPGSFYDIIDILTDEEVLPNESASSYKALIDARQQIVKEYTETDTTYLTETIQTQIDVVRQFSKYVRKYLDQETGVANAFSNEAGASDEK
ncbi:MAG TPA: DUF86 domain-containing protein [Pseudogracilibacillus sp.]|nr:DUF86 domain-containing protein [Pseudogracilibacillus sp.]